MTIKPKNRNRRRRTTRPSQGSRSNRPTFSQSHIIPDIGPALSDGSALPLSDISQNRELSNSVPSQVPRSINEQIVWTRCIFDVQQSLSAVAETQIGFQFNLSQLPNNGSWTTVFDQYCIPVAVVQIRTSENISSLSTGNPLPRIYTVLDHDDANNISVAACKGYSSCREQRVTESVTRIVYPRVALAAYSGAFTSFANQRSWIDAASPSVQHYGLKLAAEADTRSTVTELLVRVTLYFALRNHH
jgi:hypothetical protein